MLKSGTKDQDTWSGRTCDTCRSAASAVYCRADMAYLCTSCDARIHTANPVASRHDRVWVCQACERAPADFLCKADAASLCSDCDSDIHSANPLSRRHHRVPISPIPGILYGPSFAIGQLVVNGDVEDEFGDDRTTADDDGDDEDETASWLLLNPVKNSNLNGGGNLLDEYLDFEEYNDNSGHRFNTNENQQQGQYGNSCEKSYGAGDRVVPIQYQYHHDADHKGRKDDQLMQQQKDSFHLGLDYHEVSNNGYTYPISSTPQNVSLSPLDVGIVPESTMSEVSISNPRPPKGTIDLFSGPPIQLPTQLTPMDREARVMRYREKKKMRKFEKTIRYASRKAYAEIRPRIKGRFAKRTEVEVEVDQLFSSSLMTDSAYGVVPSF